MHKVKLAWRILAGKAHVLEVSKETYERAVGVADRLAAPVDDVVRDALAHYEGDVLPDLEAFIEMEAVNEVIKGMDASS